ncbi:MAG: hypothetical protein KC657_13785, partial [Myxococcales bacterium]|nr:hypothetical protein [Myxococcales bacterium]
MSKKGRGRRKSTRPSRKSRPPVGGQATAAVDALVQAAPPSRLELVQEPTLELTESSRLELVPDAADSSPAAASAPSSGTQAVAVSDPFRDEPQASADPDEISIPPIGDVHAEQFFSEGDLGAHLKGEIDDDEELWTPDRELAARRTMPAVVQRRERYIRYVKWAVVGGAVVCLAALGRAAVSRLSSDVDARMTAASPGPLAVATVAPEPAKAEPAKAAEPPAAAEPVKAAEPPAA